MSPLGCVDRLMYVYMYVWMDEWMLFTALHALTSEKLKSIQIIVSNLSSFFTLCMDLISSNKKTPTCM